MSITGCLCQMFVNVGDVTLSRWVHEACYPRARHALELVKVVGIKDIRLD